MVRQPAAGDGRGAATPARIPRSRSASTSTSASGTTRTASGRSPTSAARRTTRAAVEAECRAQLDAFRRLLDRDPTHLDSHQHAHMNEPVTSVADRLAAELGVPLRARGGIRYEGGFYGQTGKGEPVPDAISVASLTQTLSSIPAGWTELSCHPGLGMGEESSYGREREAEVRALCDPRVREAIEIRGHGAALLCPAGLNSGSPGCSPVSSGPEMAFAYLG